MVDRLIDGSKQNYSSPDDSAEQNGTHAPLKQPPVKQNGWRNWRVFFGGKKRGLTGITPEGTSRPSLPSIRASPVEPPPLPIQTPTASTSDIGTNGKEESYGPRSDLRGLPYASTGSVILPDATPLGTRRFLGGVLVRLFTGKNKRVSSQSVIANRSSPHLHDEREQTPVGTPVLPSEGTHLSNPSPGVDSDTNKSKSGALAPVEPVTALVQQPHVCVLHTTPLEIQFSEAPAPPARLMRVTRSVLPPRVFPTYSTPTQVEVRLLVAALRNLATGNGNWATAAENDMANESAWSEEDRTKNAEIWELVTQLAKRSAGLDKLRAVEYVVAGVGVSAIGLEEPGSTGTTTDSVAAHHALGIAGPIKMSELSISEQIGVISRGLGVGGSDVEQLITIMRRGRDVTMKNFRDSIETWRAEIDIKHQAFLTEMAARETTRDRKREKLTRWEPDLNIEQADTVALRRRAISLD